MRRICRIQTSARLVAMALAIGLIAPPGALAGSPTGSLSPSELPTGSPPTFPQPGTDKLAQDSWIVTLKASAHPKKDAPGLARAAGGRAGLVYRHALKGFQFKGSAAAAKALSHNPNVVSVEPDNAVHLTETVPYGISRLGAFIVGGGDAYAAGYRGAGARIAIIDTGIDLTHPDLAENIDAASGYNCVDPGQPPNDGYGHGTHVAGIAAAPYNGVGVIGIAPEATLVPIKVFDDAGNSSDALTLCGLDYVTGLNTDGNASNDIDVANMSWGDHRTWGTCADDPLHGAICAADAAGIVLVGGTGNDVADAGDFVPAAYPEVISVSAMADFDGLPGGLAGCQVVPDLLWYDCDDTFAFFSNYGASVDAIAPGVNVYSTWMGGSYKTENGTSMATPHVAGVAALIRAANPTLTPAEVRDALLTSGECPNGQWADADSTPGCSGQGTWTDDPDGIPEVLPNALRAAQLVSTGRLDQDALAVTAPTTGTFGQFYAMTYTGGSGDGDVIWRVTAGSNACAIATGGPHDGELEITSGTGTCTIRVTKTADSAYNAASADGIVTVGKADQTITFDPPPTDVAVGDTASVQASASSGLPVAYSSTTTDVCTVDASSGALTLMATGTCTIAADQAGDANWNLATQVTQDVAVGNPNLSGTVSVRVNGDPVAGATVSAWDATSGAWTGASGTDGAGFYSISLPPGSYNLYIQGGGEPASWYGGSSKATAADVAVTSTTTLDIALGKALLEGTVTVLATGDPVSGATVSAWDATSGAWTAAGTTDGAGFYFVNLPPGSYNLYVQGGGQPASWYGGSSKATATDVDVTSTTDLDIALGKAMLQGTVSVLATGELVGGATVSAWDATTGAWTAAGATDGSGAYSISLPAGSYNLYIQGGGQPASWYGGSSKATATDVAVTSTTTQDIALGKALLQGTVSVLATGTPVSGATVSAWDATTGTWTGASVTNGSGQYSISLPAGSYNLYIQGGGQPASWYGGSSKATATDVAVTSTTDLDIGLGKALLQGRVTVLASGDPVVGATVSAWDATSGAWKGASGTDGSGHYSINLPAGSYNLYIQGGGQPASWYGGTSKATAADVDVSTTTNLDIAR